MLCHVKVPLASKVQAIVGMARQATKEKLQQFLGCINFYHRFVPHLAAILAPLHDLTSSVSTQKAPLAWSDEHLEAFSAAKKALSDAVLLGHPDPKAPIALTTDASDTRRWGGPLTEHVLLAVAPRLFLSKAERDREKLQCL